MHPALSEAGRRHRSSESKARDTGLMAPIHTFPIGAVGHRCGPSPSSSPALWRPPWVCSPQPSPARPESRSSPPRGSEVASRPAEVTEEIVYLHGAGVLSV